MKFADNNEKSITTNFISFFVNKKYHFRITFEFNITNYQLTKKHLQAEKKNNIITEMKAIVEYAKTQIISARERMIA